MNRCEYECFYQNEFSFIIKLTAWTCPDSLTKQFFILDLFSKLFHLNMKPAQSNQW